MAAESSTSTPPAPAATPAVTSSDAPSSASYWQTAPTRMRQDRLILLVITGLLLALYLPGLGSYGLFDPWETHYGEVARNMVEHHNYVDPFWGSPWDPTDVKRERQGFYSKPPLTMWMTSSGMNLFGYTDLGVRFFFPLLAIMALLAIYLAVSRFTSRLGGVIAVVATAASPYFAIMGRRAVPDGPMTAVMTIGMMALAIGLFACDDDDEPSPLLYWGTIAALLFISLGQLWAMLPMDRSADVVRAIPDEMGFIRSIGWWFRDTLTVAWGKGWALALMLLPFVGWAAWRVARQKRRRMLYIYIFYICCGLCVPGKGWVAWAPMGLAILGYMLVTGEWRRFAEVDVMGGILIVFVTGHPWVVAMVGGHPGWFKRFIIHDHINRLFAGVHKLDDGGFEYYMRWLGYGVFPWIALLPAALVRLFGGLRKGTQGYTPRQKFELLILLWAVFGFFFFSRSKTKFHQYILPIVPALTILIAAFIDDLLARRVKAGGLLVGAGVGLVLWVGQDLFRLPRASGQGSQNFVNLFTYKYDREYPKFSPEATLEGLKGDALQTAMVDNSWLQAHASALLWVTFLAIGGLVLMAAYRDRRRLIGVGVLSVGGLMLAGWCLHVYLPQISKHWSQRQMWNTYYEMCTKFGPDETAEYERHMLLQSMRIPNRPDIFPQAKCKEPIVAFRTNWRGETFFSANTVIPAPETKHLKPFLEQWGNDKPFFLFTERHRVKGELEPNLPKHLKGQYQEVFGSSLKFVLLRVEAGTGDKPAPKATPKAPKK